MSGFGPFTSELLGLEVVVSGGRSQTVCLFHGN